MEAGFMSNRRRFRGFRLGFGRLAGASLGWVCLTFVGTPPVRGGADDAGTVLDRMRQAAGGPVPVGRAPEFLIEGKTDRQGTTADYSVRFTPAGMFLQTFAGPMSGKIGFNGRECWAVDRSGMPRPLELHDLD